MKINTHYGRQATVLSLFSIAGLFGTMYLTYKGTVRFGKRDAKETYPSAKELITDFGPAAGMAIGTSICILGAVVLNKKQESTLVSAYGLLSRKFSKYRGTLIDLHGEEADQEVVDAIVREGPGDHLVDSDAPEKKLLWIESETGEEFYRFEREIIDAEYHFNRNYTMRGCAPFNEWRLMLGLKPAPGGDKIGWTEEGGFYWIDFDHCLKKLPDGRSAYVVSPVVAPDIASDIEDVDLSYEFGSLATEE